jgi:hypothetical protein
MDERSAAAWPGMALGPPDDFLVHGGSTDINIESILGGSYFQDFY